LAHVRDIPCISVNALYALALNVREHKGFICPVMDAKRGEVYCAVYDNTGGDMKLSAPSRAMKLIELLSEQQSNSPLYLGDGARLEEVIKFGAHIAADKVLLQHASSVCLAGYHELKNGNVKNYKTITPDYLRKFKL
jgi:tRNA threonylcarbamoyladenosine biosynthesis protein TsaB